MNKHHSAIWVVGLHAALLSTAVLAIAFKLPPVFVISTLVIGFGFATVALVAKLGQKTDHKADPPNGVATASPAAFVANALPNPAPQDIVARVQALKNGDLRSQLTPHADGFASLRAELNAAVSSLEHVARYSQDATGTLARAGAEIEKSTGAVALATNRQMASVAEVSRRLQSLSSRCEEVSQLVEVLDDLARQTNVLALNAALEASRAGTPGKGFAMVADEVRKLAERSAAATKDVGAFVQTLEGGTADASRMLDEVQALAKSVVEGVEGTAAVASELATTAKELASTLDGLQTEATEDAAIKQALAAQYEHVQGVLTAVEPRLLQAQTPLAQALCIISRNTSKAPTNSPEAADQPA